MTVGESFTVKVKQGKRTRLLSMVVTEVKPNGDYVADHVTYAANNDRQSEKLLNCKVPFKKGE